MRSETVRRALPSLTVALLCAVTCWTAVHPGISIVRVPLAEREIRADDGVVRLALPDLSALRNAVPVFRGRLENGATRSRRVRILLDGFPRTEVVLGGGTGRSFALTLPDGMARAITGGSGTSHVLEFRGDGDDWRLTSIDAANEYATVGGAVGLSVVPARVTLLASAPAGPVLALLAILATLATALGAGFTHPMLARLHQGAAVLLVLGFGAALVLPHVSAYRVLLWQRTYWCAVVVLSPRRWLPPPGSRGGAHGRC